MSMSWSSRSQCFSIKHSLYKNTSTFYRRLKFPSSKTTMQENSSDANWMLSSSKSLSPPNLKQQKTGFRDRNHMCTTARMPTISVNLRWKTTKQQSGLFDILSKCDNTPKDYTIQPKSLCWITASPKAATT